ncbi:MAG TPA: ABC transporter substrate-binding protein [Spirochaetia bacterium]|nr:ABC transporter substrate-binding protein [Spirochaetia bacterium]
MKRFLLLAMIVGIAVAGFATGTMEEETTKIGISKIVAHPALDAVEQGIQDELTELGYTDISYDLQSANGDLSTASQIAAKFKADRVDVAIGIATPTAQALVASISDVPVVFTAVTDPVGAELVPSLAGGGGNVTGYSDLTPVREQIELLAQFGNVDAIGHVYSSGEANAVVLAEMAREAATELGIEFVEATVTNTAEVRQAAQSIADRVDVFYMSTDNTVVSALSSLTEVAMDAGVPVMSADPSSAETQDVIAAYGFDYYTMGRATGRLVARILEGADPDSIPVQYLTDADDLILHVNLDIAEQLGIELSPAVLEAADRVVENGVMREQ